MKRTQLKFYVNTDRRSKRNNKAPVYMRVTKLGKKAESRLNFELSDSEIKHWNTYFERSEQKNCPLNKHLDVIQSKFDNLIAIEFERLATCSAKDIRDELTSLKKTRSLSITVKSFMWTYLDEEIRSSNKYALGTFKNYKKALNHMDRFLSENYPNLTFHNVDFNFANSFKNYLMNDHPTIKKKGMAEVSANGIIKKFRKITNHAIQLNLLKNNPFKEVKLSNDSPKKENFPIHEVHRLFEMSRLNNLEKKQSLIFQFMCLTGCAYQDCQDLLANNFSERKDGEYLLTYKRNKTNHISSQYLTKRALLIKKEMSKFEEEIIPKTTNQNFNRTLKIIGLKQGINKPLHSHLARAIYRQLLNQTRLTEPLTIDKLMGWSSKNKIDSKYRSVTDEELFYAKNKLELILIQILP